MDAKGTLYDNLGLTNDSLIPASRNFDRQRFVHPLTRLLFIRDRIRAGSMVFSPGPISIRPPSDSDRLQVVVWWHSQSVA